MQLKESVDREVNTSIWFHCIKKEEDKADKRKDKVQRAHTHHNPKKHITQMSLLLWYKIVTVHCFVWPPAL